MRIRISELSGGLFEVVVEGPRTTTTHIVDVDDAYAEKLTSGRASKQDLIEKSFEFLLEREPNTAILRRFELPVIQRYFPEYESVISGMLLD